MDVCFHQPPGTRVGKQFRNGTDGRSGRSYETCDLTKAGSSTFSADRQEQKLKSQSSKLKRSLKPQAPTSSGAKPSARAWVRLMATCEHFRHMGQPLALANWSFS
jgi:hypothetical protein